jgi:hypothetical protein
MEAVLAAHRMDVGALAPALQHGVITRGLDLRCGIAYAKRGAYRALLGKFRLSLNALATCANSNWPLARTCAELLIEFAHEDQATNSAVDRKDGWGKGTIDAFAVLLLSQAFDIPTHYRSERPLVTAYAALLGAWRTSDEAEFQSAMQVAAEFHISRSRYSTDTNDYEFDDTLCAVFPVELLAVQALRRRDGLPEFAAGHSLVDVPWALIRDLPEVPPLPIAEAIEARMRADVPQFR